MPDRNTIRLWFRQILWNARYWKNGPLGHYPNPFEYWYDLPYYPYQRLPDGKYKMTNVVSSIPKPVDTVFNQHLYAYRLKQMQRKRERTEEK